MADLDATMRALRSRTRREILARIWDRDLSAGEIAAAFDLTAATISEHLGVLRRAGLVEMTKVGTSRRYRAKPDALAGLHGAIEDAGKWRSADDLPEQALTTTTTAQVVVAQVDLPTPPEVTFAALTDGELYSRWLQVPVSIDGDRFAATLEWGTEVRGSLRDRGPAAADRDELGFQRWQHPAARAPVDRLSAGPSRRRRQPGRGTPSGQQLRSGDVHGGRVGDGPRTSQSQHPVGPRRIGTPTTSTPPQTITNAAVGTRLTDGPNGRSNARRRLVR